MTIPRTREQVFQHECMTLMTYVDMMDHQGYPMGEDNWICPWVDFQRVYAQLKRCREAYQACFIVPEFSPNDPEHPEKAPANDN